MKILIEKAKVDRALEALKVARDQIVDPTYAPIGWSVSRLDETLGIMREALADQPAQQEPVEFKCVVIDNHHPDGIPFEQWVKPAQRTWVGLTDEERDAIFELHNTRLGGWDYSGDKVMYYGHFEDAVAATEAKLKEKNA